MHWKSIKGNFLGGVAAGTMVLLMVETFVGWVVWSTLEEKRAPVFGAVANHGQVVKSNSLQCGLAKGKGKKISKKIHSHRSVLTIWPDFQLVDQKWRSQGGAQSVCWLILPVSRTWLCFVAAHLKPPGQGTWLCFVAARLKPPGQGKSWTVRSNY